MDVIDIAKRMNHKINDLDKRIVELEDCIDKKAQAVSNYEKVMAITLIKLRNGESFELDGNKIDSPPVTIMEKIAKGLCYKEKIEAETQEALYKVLQTKIEVLKSQLNGYQSINRYLKDDTS